MGAEWQSAQQREAIPELPAGLNAGSWVRRLDEGDRDELIRFLDADPGFSIFLRGNLEQYSLNSTFVRYWGAFRIGRLAAVLMMVGRRAALYAPPGVATPRLAQIAVHEDVEFTMGRVDLVDEVAVRCRSVERREEHYLAVLRQAGADMGLPTVPVPLGSVIRRGRVADIPALTRLYIGSDGFEGLDEDRVRRTMANRVHSMRTYVAAVGTSLVSACSTSAETLHAAMIGGVWTHPDVRNRGYSTAVVAALARELIEQGRRPYLFYLMDNAPAARVYAKVGFQPIGRWSVAYLRP